MYYWVNTSTSHTSIRLPTYFIKSPNPTPTLVKQGHAELEPRRQASLNRYIFTLYKGTESYVQLITVFFSPSLQIFQLAFSAWVQVSFQQLPLCPPLCGSNCPLSSERPPSIYVHTGAATHLHWSRSLGWFLSCLSFLECIFCKLLFVIYHKIFFQWAYFQ